MRKEVKTIMKILINDERHQLCKLVERLLRHDFRSVLDYANGSVGEWEEEHFNFFKSLHCQIFHGETRVVVVFDDLEWVLKFNFFNRPTCKDVDYNDREYRHYVAAGDRGLGEYFAAMEYLGVFEDDVDVYAQEKVEIDEDAVSDSFYQYMSENLFGGVDTQECSSSSLNERISEEAEYLENEDRIYAMITDGAAEDLIDFIQYYDINDLHSGNWGYRDGQPVLIDYAGF